MVVVDPSHPWARRRKPLRANELAATPLIVRESGSGTRITLETTLSGHEVASPLLELGSNSAVKISVRAPVWRPRCSAPWPSTQTSAAAPCVRCRSTTLTSAADFVPYGTLRVGSPVQPPIWSSSPNGRPR